MKILVVISLAIMAADAYSDSAFDSADWDQLFPDYVHFSQWAQAHKKVSRLSKHRFAEQRKNIV